MKHVCNALLLITLAAGCKSKGKNGWPEAEKKAFIENCEKNGSAMGDKAKSYCACMLEKVEAKYPNASKAGELDMNTMMDMAKDCLK
jgi:hypothetical protein